VDNFPEVCGFSGKNGNPPQFCHKPTQMLTGAEMPLWVGKMWVDPNLNDFYSRVSRIEKAHARGYGFEARGTVSRRAPSRLGQQSLRFLKPLIVALALGVALKGLIHYYVGAQTYESRVSALAAGNGFDPVGAWLMHADQATLFVSAQLQALAPR
jgi:hypothetical protein